MENKLEETNIVEPETEEKNPEILEVETTKKRPINWIIFALVATILVLASAVAIYFKIQNNPKQILARMINDAKEEVQELLVPVENVSPVINTDKLSTEGNINFKTKINEVLIEASPEMSMLNGLLSSLNDVTVKYQSSVNTVNNTLLYRLTPNKKEKDLFTIEYQNDKNKQYILLKDIFDKYIQLEDSTISYDEMKNLTVEDIDYLFETTKKALIKNLNKDYFKTEKNIHTTDDKKAMKTVLSLNHENTDELINKIIEDLKENKKANELLLKMTEDWKNAKANNVLDTNETLELEIYTNPVTLEVYEYAIKDNENNFIRYQKGEKTKLTISNNQEPIVIYLTKKENGYNIEIKDSQDTTIALLTITSQANELKGNMKITAGEGVIVSANITMKIKNVKENSYQLETVASINASLNDIDLITFDLNYDAEVKTGVLSLTPITPEKVIKFSELKEKDVSEIEQKLMAAIQQLFTA